MLLSVVMICFFQAEFNVQLVLLLDLTTDMPDTVITLIQVQCSMQLCYVVCDKVFTVVLNQI